MGDMSTWMQASLAALEAESQVACNALAKQEQRDKLTTATYKRHVDRYQKWWVAYQAEKVGTIPGWITIPAFTITVAKATVFFVMDGIFSCLNLKSLSLD